MPATALDSNTALILIDLQKGIVRMPGQPFTTSDVVANGARLAAAFRKAGHPVVLVNAGGAPPGRTQTGHAANGQRPADWSELVPELEQQPSDITVTKKQWGAFYGTGLDLELRRRGVTHVVVAGIATSMGVESTARTAHEHGYHVTLAVDTMTDLDPDAHRNSVEKIFPRLGETDTADAIIALLG